MKWNWQLANWPNFVYEAEALRTREATFLQRAGELSGAFKHLGTDTHKKLTVELISEEALQTSAIEGEILDRGSLQSSIRKQLGFQADTDRRIPGAERGVAELMVDVYTDFDAPLDQARLFKWHKSLLNARRDLDEIGTYRTGSMQIVSGPIHSPKIHFEAPPSDKVPREMKVFLQWYEESRTTLGPLIHSGITHLYFLAIHPFSDGNGRIARALSEKSLAQAVQHPTLIALAHTIEKSKKAYYAALQRTNQSLRIDDWLDYFADTVLEAQTTSLKRVEWLIEKARLFRQHGNQLNSRQSKVLNRLFDKGSEGFEGGLSAENYIALTNTSRATATRDLQDLVAKKLLRKTGELKHTRYWLKLSDDRTQKGGDFQLGL